VERLDSSERAPDETRAVSHQPPVARISRLFFIDNLRVLLIVLVVIHHLAITYGAVGSWYYQDPAKDALTSALLTIVTATNQAFFLGFFFMISAYFVPESCDRKGAGPFLRDRLLRLGIPLLVYDIIIDPFVVFMAGGFQGSYWTFYSNALLTMSGIGQGPSWFLEALLYFVIGYALWRVFRNTRSSPRIETGYDNPVDNRGRRPYPAYWQMLAYVSGLATADFLIRLQLPINWDFQLLNFQFPFFPQYISMFAIGIIAYRRGWFTKVPDSMGKSWSIVAIASISLFPVLAIAGGAVDHIEYFEGGVHWQALAYALWEAVVAVAMITSLLVLFRRRFNTHGRVRKFLSANAYAVYIIHPIIVVGVGFGLHTVAVYPLLKFVVGVIIAVPACFGLAGLIQTIPFAKRIL